MPMMAKGTYDKAIKELKLNQENLIKHFNKQLSLNHHLITQYQETIKNMSFNFQRISEVINTIRGEDQEFVNTLTLFKISLLDLTQIVERILTAINFASLNTLHLSIIDEKSINSMKIELAKYHDKSNFYYSDNVLFTRTISVDYYVTEEHVVFLLHVPLLDPSTYDLYHLYSVPTPESTIIIPPTSYVTMTERHTYYLKEKCAEIQQQFFCTTSQIERNYQQDTCVQNLLKVREDPRCVHVKVEITDTLVETISDQKYLIIAPTDTLVHLVCGSEEVRRLKGTYLVDVPYSCKFATKNFEYANLEGFVVEEPVFLPPSIKNISSVKPIQLNLKSFNLDELSKLTLDRENNEPISFLASDTLWTHSNFPILILAIFCAVTFALYYYRTHIINKCRTIFISEPTSGETNVQDFVAFPVPAKRST